jgi:hypothetical protein
MSCVHWSHTVLYVLCWEISVSWGHCSKVTFTLNRLVALSTASCFGTFVQFWKFKIGFLYSKVCQNFHLSYQLHSCLWSVGTKGCVNICLVSPCSYRNGCKSTPFSLVVCHLVSSHVPFVLLLLGTDVRVPLCQVEGKVPFQECLRNKKMPRGLEVSIMCHTCIVLCCTATLTGLYCAPSRARGQCLLWVADFVGWVFTSIWLLEI